MPYNPADVWLRQRAVGIGDLLRQGTQGFGDWLRDQTGIQDQGPQAEGEVTTEDTFVGPNDPRLGFPKGFGDGSYLVKPKPPEIPNYAGFGSGSVGKAPQVGNWPSDRRPPLLPQDPPAAAVQTQPPVQNRVTRGPNGEILLTNIPGVGKDLPMHLPFDPKTGLGETIGGGLSGGGQREFARVRAGKGGFSRGAPDPTEKTWQEVMAASHLNEAGQSVPTYSPLQRRHWVESNMESAPVEALRAELGLKEAEAEMTRRQGGRFAAETERLRMSPLDRALEQTNIPLERYVAEQSKIDPGMKNELEFRQREFIRRYLVVQGVLKEGRPVQAAPVGAVTEQLERYALTQAILEYIRARDTSLQEIAARQGIGLNPYGG